MLNKHLNRLLILQILFEQDMRKFSGHTLEQSLDYAAEVFLGKKIENKEEILDFLLALLERRELIDKIIEKASETWNLKKMSIVDRNILRLAVYELLYGDKQVAPSKVVINEAVELAKQFGGDKSYAFVNGVLGAVYRELGEPEGSLDFQKKDIPLEEMEIDKKGSAVVYSIDKNGVIRIGMVHDVFGYWTLSKGSIQEGESVEEGTRRAIKEETNWDIEILEKLGEGEYIAYPPERGPVRKQVSYFLGKSDYTKPQLKKERGGLDDVAWFSLDEISDLHIYEDVARMLIQAIPRILKREKKEE